MRLYDIFHKAQGLVKLEFRRKNCILWCMIIHWCLIIIHWTHSIVCFIRFIMAGKTFPVIHRRMPSWARTFFEFLSKTMYQQRIYQTKSVLHIFIIFRYLISSRSLRQRGKTATKESEKFFHLTELTTCEKQNEIGGGKKRKHKSIFHQVKKKEKIPLRACRQHKKGTLCRYPILMGWWRKFNRIIFAEVKENSEKNLCHRKQFFPGIFIHKRDIFFSTKLIEIRCSSSCCWKYWNPFGGVMLSFMMKWNESLFTLCVKGRNTFWWNRW